jgi:hypothetical protein
MLVLSLLLGQRQDLLIQMEVLVLSLLLGQRQDLLIQMEVLALSQLLDQRQDLLILREKVEQSLALVLKQVQGLDQTHVLARDQKLVQVQVLLIDRQRGLPRDHQQDRRGRHREPHLNRDQLLALNRGHRLGKTDLNQGHKHRLNRSLEPNLLRGQVLELKRERHRLDLNQLEPHHLDHQVLVKVLLEKENNKMGSYTIFNCLFFSKY